MRQLAPTLKNTHHGVLPSHIEVNAKRKVKELCEETMIRSGSIVESDIEKVINVKEKENHKIVRHSKETTQGEVCKIKEGST